LVLLSRLLFFHLLFFVSSSSCFVSSLTFVLQSNDDILSHDSFDVSAGMFYRNTEQHDTNISSR